MKTHPEDTKTRPTGQEAAEQAARAAARRRADQATYEAYLARREDRRRYIEAELGWSNEAGSATHTRTVVQRSRDQRMTARRPIEAKPVRKR